VLCVCVEGGVHPSLVLHSPPPLTRVRATLRGHVCVGRVVAGFGFLWEPKGARYLPVAAAELLWAWAAAEMTASVLLGGRNGPDDRDPLVHGSVGAGVTDGELPSLYACAPPRGASSPGKPCPCFVSLAAGC
jgi:hypothetical protein